MGPPASGKTTVASALAGRLAEAWRIDDDLPAQDLPVDPSVLGFWLG